MEVRPPRAVADHKLLAVGHDRTSTLQFTTAERDRTVRAIGQHQSIDRHRSAVKHQRTSPDDEAIVEDVSAADRNVRGVAAEAADDEVLAVGNESCAGYERTAVECDHAVDAVR